MITTIITMITVIIIISFSICLKFNIISAGKYYSKVSKLEYQYVKLANMYVIDINQINVYC